jgi:tetratricopeptide (TPR) repeat protein
MGVIRAFVMLAAIAFAAPAFAEELDAKQSFEVGRAHFMRGEYADALPHLRRAYVLSQKRPAAIRALAQCERALGNYDEAIALFREYLQATPPPPDREAIEKTIEHLEQKRPQPAELEREPEEADFVWEGRRSPSETATPELTAKPVVAEVEERSIFEQPWFWIAAVVAVGGAAAITFAVANGGEPEPYGGSLGRVLHR